MRRVTRVIAWISVVIGAVAAVATIADSRSMWWVAQTVSDLAGGLWTRAALIFVILALSSVAGALLLDRTAVSTLSGAIVRGRAPSSAVVRIAGLTLVLVALALVLVRVMYFDMLPAPEGEVLFPQVAALGPISIRTFGANGRASYRFISHVDDAGPENGYAEIVLQTFGKTTDENCGWVLFMLRGIDLSGFSTLRFQIRGTRGYEQVGIKAKDASGVEVSLYIVAPYLREGSITSRWQDVTIPLIDFGNVNFGLLENLSFFTTGALSGTRPQRFMVGDFRLSK